MNARRETDLLGPPYTCELIELTPRGDERPVAALVHRPAEAPTRGAMLYVHGYNDYFFHTELADLVVAAGWDLYALDLRRYGRALLPGQDHGQTRDLTEYFEELDEALRRIRERDGHTLVCINSHSTGGLITVLHAAARGADWPVDRVVLNAPFLSFPPLPFERTFLGAVKQLHERRPGLRPIPSVPHYGQSLHRPTAQFPRAFGEWSFDPTLKLVGGLRMSVGWLGAVSAGHRAVAAGLGIQRPILVLTSDRSGGGVRINPSYVDTDVVLDVRRIGRLSRGLGPDVSLRRIPRAKHDVWLSVAEARERAYDEMFSWMARLDAQSR